MFNFSRFDCQRCFLKPQSVPDGDKSRTISFQMYPVLHTKTASLFYVKVNEIFTGCLGILPAFS